MFHANCKLHITHIVYCMVHNAQWAHVNYPLRIVNRPLPVAQCKLHTMDSAHCITYIVQCRLHKCTVHIALYKCTVHIALYKCTLHIALCTFQIALCTSSFNFVSLWNRSSQRSLSLPRTVLSCWQIEGSFLCRIYTSYLHGI